MDCYKEFAHIYDELINGDIDYKKWADVIIGIVNDKKIDKKDYLDIACGTGNMTEQIAPYFVNNWAVDLSYDMLTEAEKKIRSKGIKTKFVCQDICELNLNKKFDFITCCLDSTNYILDYNKLKDYFKGVSNHLKDEGMFIFDINSHYKLTNILGNNVYNYDDENVTYVWENTINDNIVDMYLTFFVKEDELYRRFDEEHSERAYTHDEIKEALENSELEIIKTMDNYEKDSLKDDTERVVYVVKKKC